MKTRALFGEAARLVPVLLAVALTLGAAGGYHVIQRIPIPGDSGWDYITADSQARRLYVPHGTEAWISTPTKSSEKLRG